MPLMRLLEVLEHIGKWEARQVPETLANGVPGARLTKPMPSLDRLAKCAAPNPLTSLRDDNPTQTNVHRAESGT